jgi:starch phosphorylase
MDEKDEYLHMADLSSYLDTQDKAALAYQAPAEWTQRAILNVAHAGKFSSDRTVRQYARDIWHIEPV